MSPRIRCIREADVDPVCRLLYVGFVTESGVASRFAPDVWKRLFTYDWLTNMKEACHGLVLEVEGEIVGFIGMVHATRQIAGKSGLICGLTSWYVRRDYRRWSIALLSAAVKDRNKTYTCFTSNQITRRALRVLGFTSLDERKVALLPLLNCRTLFKIAPEISMEPEVVRQSLDPQRRRIFDDHSRYECLQIFIRDKVDYAHVIVKRRALSFTCLGSFLPSGAKIPYSEVLHCSAPTVLARHIERIKLAILRHQQTVALVVDERLLPEKLHFLSVSRPQLYRSPLFTPKEIDKLYSEFVLLPI